MSAEEARTKIRAAVDARREAGVDIIIVARTDARSAIDLDEALRRAKSFEKEGADIVFIEALKTKEELRMFAESITAPTWANMMPKTPLVSRSGLAEMGFKVVTYNIALTATIHAVRGLCRSCERRHDAVAAACLVRRTRGTRRASRVQGRGVPLRAFRLRNGFVRTLERKRRVN